MAVAVTRIPAEPRPQMKRATSMNVNDGASAVAMAAAEWMSRPTYSVDRRPKRSVIGP